MAEKLESQGPALRQSDPPGKTDLWKHRNSNMACLTCMWFVAKNEKLGRCRRRAPTMNGFPAVFHGDWCGDHKLDENRI